MTGGYYDFASIGGVFYGIIHEVIEYSLHPEQVSLYRWNRRWNIIYQVMNGRPPPQFLHDVPGDFSDIDWSGLENKSAGLLPRQLKQVIDKVRHHTSLSYGFVDQLSRALPGYSFIGGSQERSQDDGQRSL